MEVIVYLSTRRALQVRINQSNKHLVVARVRGRPAVSKEEA